MSTPTQDMEQRIISAAYAFVESMTVRADASRADAPLWHGWALREAFLAGAQWELQQIAKDVDAMRSSQKGETK